MANSMTGVRGLIRLAAERRGALALACLLMMISNAALLVQPLITGRLLNHVARHQGTAQLVLLLVGIFVTGAIFVGLGSYVLSRTGEQIVRDLRTRLGTHLLRMRVSEHDSRRSGDLLSRASGDTMLLRGVLTTGPVTAITGLLTLLGSIALMAYVDPFLLGVTLGAVFATFLVLLLIVPMVKPAALQAQQGVGRLIAVLDRALRAIRTVKASLAEDRESTEIGVQAQSAYQAGVRLAALQALITPAMMIGVQGSFLLVLGLGGQQVASGTLTISDLVTFLLYLTTLAVPMTSLGQFANDLQKGLAALDRVSEVLAAPAEPTAAAEPDGVSLEVALHAQPGAAQITFDRVVFGYTPERQILPGTSFQVPAGEHTAIVGPSGAGKSTVLSLIERFYEPEDGQVRIDGVDVRDIPINRLRRMIAYVEQETPVLAGTVAENIRYAHPDAPDEAVADVVRRVRLEGLLERLPDGLDTNVGDAGVLMSGGERQRIAIARALLGSPRVLLLDEATSQLDAMNELAMRETIRREAGPSCTVITVAHRLSTVVDADQIIVLDQGRVAGIGTHAGLLNSSVVYRDLVHGQLLSASADADYVEDDLPEVMASSTHALAEWQAIAGSATGMRRWLGRGD